MRLPSCLLAAALLTAGCASGPAFKKISEVPPGKALVYIYRPATMHGAAFTPKVTVNDLGSIPLPPGGYYPYFLAPGKVTISILLTGERSVDFDVKAGETYYVRAGTVFMALGIPYVEQVPAVTGAQEIAECALQPDPTGRAGVPASLRYGDGPARGSYPRPVVGAELVAHVGRLKGVQTNAGTKFPFSLSVADDGGAQRVCEACPVPSGAGKAEVKPEEGLVCFVWQGITYPGTGCFTVLEVEADKFEMRGTNGERPLRYSLR